MYTTCVLHFLSNSIVYINLRNAKALFKWHTHNLSLGKSAFTLLYLKKMATSGVSVVVLHKSSDDCNPEVGTFSESDTLLVKVTLPKSHWFVERNFAHFFLSLQMHCTYTNYQRCIFSKQRFGMLSMDFLF